MYVCKHIQKYKECATAKAFTHGILSAECQVQYLSSLYIHTLFMKEQYVITHRYRISKETEKS